jgi:hypothetical protein
LRPHGSGSQSGRSRRSQAVVGGLIVMAAVLADILLKKSGAVPERVEQAAA